MIAHHFIGDEMIRKFLCFVFGHKYGPARDESAPLRNLYVAAITCRRCEQRWAMLSP